MDTLIQHILDEFDAHMNPESVSLFFTILTHKLHDRHHYYLRTTTGEIISHPADITFAIIHAHYKNMFNKTIL